MRASDFFDDLEEEIGDGAENDRPTLVERSDHGDRSSRTEESKESKQKPSKDRQATQYHKDRSSPALKLSVSALLPESKAHGIPGAPKNAFLAVPLSQSSQETVPLFLYRFDRSSVLVWSGIRYPKEAVYGVRMLLPDVRILSRDRIDPKAWFIPEENPERLACLRFLFPHFPRTKWYVPASVYAFVKKSFKQAGFSDDSLHSFEWGETIAVDSTEWTVHQDRVSVSSASGVTFSQCFAKTGDRYEHSVENGKIRKPYVLRSQKHDASHPSFSSGDVLAIQHDTVHVDESVFPIDTLFVDGYGVGIQSSHTMKMREQMAVSGVVTVLITADSKSRAIFGNIRIESRGLAYLHEAREIHRFIAKVARMSYEETIKDIPDIEENDLIKILKKDLEKELSYRIDRNPLFMPIITSV